LLEPNCGGDVAGGFRPEKQTQIDVNVLVVRDSVIRKPCNSLCEAASPELKATCEEDDRNGRSTRQPLLWQRGDCWRRSRKVDEDKVDTNHKGRVMQMDRKALVLYDNRLPPSKGNAVSIDGVRLTRARRV